MSPSNSVDRLRVLAFALGALPALALLASELWVFGDLAGFPLDDSWIHLQFARNLAAGEGLAFRPGELVAGSTAPLWTALLAIGRGSPEFSKMLGLSTHLVGLALVGPLAIRLGAPRGAAAVATIAFGWTDRLVFSATSGMEVSLFNALMLAGLLRESHDRLDPRRPPVSFLLFGLAALARPEGLLLAPLAAASRWLSNRPGTRSNSRSGSPMALALAAVVIAPVALVHVAIWGSPLPTTLGAKSAGPPLFELDLRSFRSILGILFEAQPTATLLAAAGVAVMAGRLHTARDRGLLLPIWTLALPTASVLLASEEFLVGQYGRYFFPLLPCVVVLAALGGSSLLEPLEPGSMAARARRSVLVVGISILLIPPIVRTGKVLPFSLQSRANVEDSDGAAASWLAANVDPSARLAVVDIGLLGYRLPNPLVDLGGIISPGRQEFLRRERARGVAWPVALQRWLEEQRPEYVISFPRWMPLLEREPARFRPLARFRIRDNVAMAGDELVVYATPWTQTPPKASGAAAIPSSP